MVCIMITDYLLLMNNIKLALLKEIMGLGPKRYCLIRNRTPRFYTHVGLVLQYLPRHKMFIFLRNKNRRSIFGREPWLTWWNTICKRPSLTLAEFWTNFITQKSPRLDQDYKIWLGLLTELMGFWKKLTVGYTCGRYINKNLLFWMKTSMSIFQDIL